MEKYDKYKAKYKKIKALAKGGKKKSRGLVAEETFINDLDTSSSEKEDEALICLDRDYCLANDAEFQSDIFEVARKCSAIGWDLETLEKVHNFRNYSLK